MPTFSGTVVATSEYCTVSDLKTYLGITGASDDTLLTNLIARAQKAIETYTRRVFKCAADTTRKFTVGENTVGDTLYLDDDLCQVTSVSNDVDGTPRPLVKDTHYVTLPRNRTPWYGFKLLTSASEFWDYTVDPENGVTVTGRWAYSVTPPDDIVGAIIEWSAYGYKKKDAQVFEVSADPVTGQLIIPKGVPAGVKSVLDFYRRPDL